jgi:hypothetical protein
VSAQTPTAELPEDAAIANVRRQAEILLGENALNGCWNLLARCFPAELFIRLKLTLPRQLKHEAAKYVPTSQPSRYLPLTYSAPRPPRPAPTYREHRAARPDRERELDTSILSEADRQDFEDARRREEELKQKLKQAKADSALRNARIRELGEIARQEAALEERKRKPSKHACAQTDMGRAPLDRNRVQAGVGAASQG